jgi:hypothetical protein
MTTHTALAAALGRHVTPALARDMARHMPPGTARAIRSAIARDARRQRVEEFRQVALERGILWLRPILWAAGVDKLSKLPDAAIDAALGTPERHRGAAGDPIAAYNAIADATGCKRFPTEPPTLDAASPA